MKELEAQK